MRAKAAEGIITVRAVAYNVLDDYRSVFAPGCLTASLNRKLPIFCHAHDWQVAIGRGISWRDTAAGPEVTARIDTDPRVPVARQVLAQLESGTLKECSIGFSNAKRRSPTNAEAQRWPGVDEIIISASCDEVSIVALAAVPGAELVSMRSSMSKMRADLAAGRISPAQYRARVRMDKEIDEAISIVARKGILGRAIYAEWWNGRP